MADLCSFLAPSMFGVYLFHESAIGRKVYQIPMAWITENWQWMPDAGNILLCVCFTFLVSLCVDLMRRVFLWSGKKAFQCAFMTK